LQSKGLSRVFSNTAVQKHQFFGTQLSSQSNSHIHTWPLENGLIKMKSGGEGDARGWDGWMASSIRWTRVWVDYGRWDGQGGLACCGSWGRKESDRTERLNWTEQYKFLNNILNTIIWKMNLVGFFWKSFSLLTWYREISPSRGTDCFSEELTLLEIKPLFFKCVLRESYVKILIAI